MQVDRSVACCGYVTTVKHLPVPWCSVLCPGALSGYCRRRQRASSVLVPSVSVLVRPLRSWRAGAHVPGGPMVAPTPRVVGPRALEPAAATARLAAARHRSGGMPPWPRAVAVLLLMAAAGVCGGEPPPPPPLPLTSRTVRTKYGDVSGVIVSLDSRHLEPVEVFRGVPYASPPVGSLRFMPPVTGALWSGVKMADKFGPVCPQRLPDISNETAALRRMPKGRLEHLRRLLPYLSEQSEDCLYLNIYAPVQGTYTSPIFRSIDTSPGILTRLSSACPPLNYNRDVWLTLRREH